MIFLPILKPFPKLSIFHQISDPLALGLSQAGLSGLKSPTGIRSGHLQMHIGHQIQIQLIRIIVLLGWIHHFFHIISQLTTIDVLCTFEHFSAPPAYLNVQRGCSVYSVDHCFFSWPQVGQVQAAYSNCLNASPENNIGIAVSVHNLFHVQAIFAAAKTNWVL
ncbi:hypothetical protein BpHYR1_013094 [Brachionus plicatilis]|uniref:Uncharacterized protein n=1 Tax=Brachionus plicatilis TaxID=10195 RepID=A0A3M7PA29_BRAPC|nr:hypothetical protein BpHYR1_013094 [Brachionus plicatilis]